MFSTDALFRELRQRTVVVTGAGGFLGPRVVQVLSCHGATIRALVSPPGHDAVVLHSDRVQNVFAEITDAAAIADLVTRADVVVHMAGPPSVGASLERPAEYARIHTVGTATVLDACRKTGVTRLVYISSAEVYGVPQRDAVGEDHPLQPRSPYGAAKAGAEYFVHAFAAATEVSSVILRPFSIYGRGSHSCSVVGKVMRMARSEDAILLDDPRPVRDFCHVDDFADAVVRACIVPIQGVIAINVATGTGTSIGDLAKMVIGILQRNIPVRENPSPLRPPKIEIHRLVGDPSRASHILGWHPTLALKAGLEQSI